MTIAKPLDTFLQQKENGYLLSFYVAAVDAIQIFDHIVQKTDWVVESKSEFGETLLHIAAEQNSKRILRYIIGKPNIFKKLVKQTDSEGETALMKHVLNASFNNVYVDVINLLKDECGMMKSGETALFLLLSRMCEEEVFLDDQFTKQNFEEVLIALKAEWGIKTHVGCLQVLFDEGRTDLFNITAEYIKFDK